MGAVNSKVIKSFWICGFGLAGLFYLLYGKKIRGRWWNHGEQGMQPIRGLKNVGSTCYLNAVLQALSSCWYLVQWLANKDDQNRSDFPPHLYHYTQYTGFDYPMISVLYRAILVINRVIENDEHYDDEYLMEKVPRDIIRTLRDLEIDLVNFQEQDTFECLQHILCVLQNEVAKSIHRRSVDCILDEDDASEVSGELISVSEVESELPSASTTAPPTPNPHPRLATPEYINNVASWDVVHDPKKAVKGIYSKRKKSTEKETTPQLALNFPCKGITASVLQCLHCLYKPPVKLETFDSLTLIIPKIRDPNAILSVRYLLAELQKPVIVTQVDCEGCSRVHKKKAKSAFSKTLYFVRLPPVLCLHILQLEWRNDGLSKITDYVKYEERLSEDNLNHWSKSFNLPQTEMAVHEAGDSSLPPKPKVAAKRHSDYELKAVIAHCGDADSGHFFTIRKIPENPEYTGISRWAYVSDECVMSISRSQVFQHKPYLLFYETMSKPNVTYERT